MLKELRFIISDRNEMAKKSRWLNKPVFISTLAAVGVNKLKMLLTQETLFIRTQVNVMLLKDELIKERDTTRQLRVNTQMFESHS